MALLIPLHQRSLLYSEILIGDSDNKMQKKNQNKKTEENSGFDGVDCSPVK